MTPEEFAEGLAKRLKTRSPEQIEDAEKAARKIQEPLRTNAFEAVLDKFKFYPTRAEIWEVVETLRPKVETSDSGYNQALGGYPVWHCRVCDGHFPELASGTRCPYCNTLRRGAESLVIKVAPVNFKEEARRARERMEALALEVAVKKVANG